MRKLLYIILAGGILAGCSETDRALLGGGASINQPRQLAESIYAVTCQRGRLTECVISSRRVCRGPIEILEQSPRAGFVAGNPTQLIDVSFRCGGS